MFGEVRLRLVLRVQGLVIVEFNEEVLGNYTASVAFLKFMETLVALTGMNDNFLLFSGDGRQCEGSWARMFKQGRGRETKEYVR